MNCGGVGKIELQFEGSKTDSTTKLYTTLLPPMKKVPDTAMLVQRPVFPDSVSIIPAPYYKAGSFKQWLLGKNYRTEWTTSIKVPVLDIGKANGGLTPTKRGGGMQSRSLRLEDASGKEFALRSIEKYPDKTLPEELRQTFIKDAVVDGISASYPYAALSVPPLQKQQMSPISLPAWYTYRMIHYCYSIRMISETVFICLKKGNRKQ